MTDLKPRSFRIDDETMKKFQAISKTINGNQQEALSKLIEVYQLQADKAIITDRKADIDDFENYITLLSQMYRKSLEDYQNCTEKVRATFHEQLESKDGIILKLQNENNALKSERDQAVSACKSLEEQIKLLSDKIKNEFEVRLTDMQKMLDDNASHINLLKEKNLLLKQSAENSDRLRNECESAKTEIAGLKKQLEDQSMEMRETELELKEQRMNEVTAIKEKYLAEIEAYQKQRDRAILDKQIENQKQSEKSKRNTRKTSTKKSANEAIIENPEDKTNQPIQQNETESVS